LAEIDQVDIRIEHMASARSLLVIGGNGFIGQHLAEIARASWTVYIADQSLQGGADNCYRLDVTDAEGVRGLCKRIMPDAVVNLAAISDIDRCEHEQRHARAVNVLGAANVAEACATQGARLVYLSSAAIFDGFKHGYREDDPANPLSVYGQTKFEAEKAIRALLPSTKIVRPALVLGFGRVNGTNALLNKWVDSWSQGKLVTVPTEEYRNPIDAETLARIVLCLAEHPNANGVFHAGSLDSASRYEIAQEVAKVLGYSPSLVIPQKEYLSDRAPRGRDHFLLTDRIRETCHIPLGTIDEVVRRSLSELAKG
jgi:dTDP-4-dehydrorhamnose reductase